MAIIFKFLKKIDQFGVPFLFKYNSEEKYTTCLGGIIFFIFCIVLVSYFIINLIPFFRKENFTLQFYTMNLQKTEEIKLKESKTAFAFGLTCSDDNTTKRVRELFNLNLQFYEQTKVKGKKISNINNITTHNCNTEDFYNLHNDSFEILNIKDLLCIDQKEFIDHKLEGIYTDQLFTYYKFTVSSKNYSKDIFDKIYNYLQENECKLQLYYTDISLDLSDYNNPISNYINSLFLQLNPTLIQEKNVFFINYHLFNDSKLFHIFEQDEIPRIMAGFSRIEEYSAYKGLSRYSSKPSEYENYAKLYIRVDNKKEVIKRKYQDFMEFFADNSSLLSAIFVVLNFILGFYAQFKANHSITKKLFYFEGIENNKFEELKKIKDLINTTEGKDIKIYTKNNDKNDKTENEKLDNTILPIYSKTNPIKNMKNYLPRESEINIAECNNETKENKEKNESNLIKYTSYYMHEMIGAIIPSCCKTQKFKFKESLIKQSYKIFENKLDIFLYIRNMFLFESINQIYLDNPCIIDFLSRPIIYLNKKEEAKFKKDIYKVSNELNFDILFERILKLYKKTEKTKIEQNLIFLLKQQLNEVK